MNTELAVREQPIASTLQEVMDLGSILAKSGFFADSRDASQAVVKVLAGRELGFGPIASMKGVYIVKGQVTLSANMIAAAIRRSRRYDYRIGELSNQKCVLHFFENGKQLHPSIEYSMEDAQTAGLAGGVNWKQHPRNMLFARCLSNGAKWHCPDIFNGPIYTPDELGAEVDGETGEVTVMTVVRSVDGATGEIVDKTTTTTTTETTGNGNGDKKEQAAFASYQDAIRWGLMHLVFDHEQHAKNTIMQVANANGWYGKGNPDNKLHKLEDLYPYWIAEVNQRTVAREGQIRDLLDLASGKISPMELADVVAIVTAGRTSRIEQMLPVELEKAARMLEPDWPDMEPELHRAAARPSGTTSSASPEGAAPEKEAA